MRITFQLRFHTHFGQSLWLTGDSDLFGQGRIDQALPLQYLDAELWQATILIPDSAVPQVPLSYRYVLRQPDGTLHQDCGQGRHLDLTQHRQNTVVVVDAWNPPGQFENVFYTEPFRQVLLQPAPPETPAPPPAAATHTFRVRAPLLGQDQTLCLLGAGRALGHWNPQTPVLLQQAAGDDCLTAQVDLGGESFPLPYKYGVYDVRRKAFVRYEEGTDRLLHETRGLGRHTILQDGFARLPSTTWKATGVAIPVFSLRSESSFGVGEFTDLKRLADWCACAGLKLIQILPVNDTSATFTWTDSYPYAAISAFALHPQYLNLAEVATGRNRERLSKLEPERKRLNALEAVDYEAVLRTKLAFLKQVFPSEKARVFRSRDYQAFFNHHRDWLVPYASFCLRRDRFGTPDFTQWPADAVAPDPPPGAPPRRGHRKQSPEPGAAKSLLAETEELEFHYFVQYHLHRQLRAASEYAHAKGVILKGDIAIGVCRHGSDTWQQPDLYHLDLQAGAPPDAFAVRGQNWGFPTYNWPRMKADGFAWWKRRYQQMGCYFDAFRIDHILGFFRIWSIPLDAVEGILGHFEPAIPVTAAEFAQRGIALDPVRYTRPFITDPVVSEWFGRDADEVKARFLDATGEGTYALRPEFAAQRSVERHFAALEDNERNRRIRQGLFDLISNVILLQAEEPSGQAYHFRFGIDTIPSFLNLESRTRDLVWELYVDYFFRRQEEFWRREAMEKLPALQRVTNMLVCGEDLGLVPACVPDTMKELGLLSLEIQRMPKKLNQQFFRPSEAPYLSVVTPSTHDMSTIRGWWREDRALIEQFYHQELGQAGPAPQDCEPWIGQAIVAQHLASPAMWSIFQLQDLLGMSAPLRRPNPENERINIPANPKHYWRYRMHLSLEDLLQADAFNQLLRTMIRENGRG